MRRARTTRRWPVAGAGSRAQHIPVDQVEQVRGELDGYAQFEGLVADYVEMNEALCKAKAGPPGPGVGRRAAPAATDGEQGGGASSPTTTG